jgi:hypothetical protein
MEANDSGQTPQPQTRPLSMSMSDKPLSFEPAPIGDEYAVVNKPKPPVASGDGDVYSEVDKTKKKKKPAKDGKGKAAASPNPNASGYYELSYFVCLLFSYDLITVIVSL